MNPKILVIDYGPHIVTGPNNQCECGIDANGNSRTCYDILQDMVARNLAQYSDGKVPLPVIDLGEDEAAPATDLDQAPEAARPPTVETAPPSATAE